MPRPEWFVNGRAPLRVPYPIMPHMKQPLLFLLAMCVLFLAACAGVAGEIATPLPATAVPTPLPQPGATDTAAATLPATELPATVTAVPTTAAVETPPVVETAAPPPSPTPTGPQVTSGQTAEGVYFRGDPDAPVTILDYSDFL